MMLNRGKALTRAALCGMLLLAWAGPAAAEAEQPAPPQETQPLPQPQPQETSPQETLPQQASPAKVEKEEKLLLPAVPIVAFSRETSFLFGAMMVRALRWENRAADARPNTIAVSAFYSLENQWAVGFAPSVYLQDEDYLVKAQLYHHRTPARIWGVGTEAGEHGTREDFTATGTGITFSATRKVFRSLRLGPGIWFGSARIPGKEPGGILESGALTGSDGGTDIGLELQAEWDDRDNIYAPTTGTYLQFWAGLHRDYLDSDFSYDDYLLDLRRFFPLGAGQVLAVQAKGRVMVGDPPFYRLPSIGGIGMMRGLFDGRFRDKTMVAAQAEYRFPIWKAVGGAVFAGVGEVAERPADLSLDDLQLTGGAGLRVTLDPKDRINLRIDVGFSRYGIFPIVVITEAF